MFKKRPSTPRRRSISLIDLLTLGLQAMWRAASPNGAAEWLTRDAARRR